ncbi:hypothetical protein [uncultured Treponema sp.]|uniref:hypothetical protein n=1 Tax=uncultured Treponema sp. TaxID=162155 RepID=UPI0015BBC0CB|nr:hypothetical protein [uncultured Treponema sp.]
MKKVALKLFFVEIFALGLLTFFAGCKDVGLGESVDTKAPTVKITYPPSLAIIRDSFVLYGDCWDDKNVKTVKVSVSKKDEASDSSSLETILTDIPAQIDQKQEHWSVTLNKYDLSAENYYNGWQLADGTYVITVTVSDGQSSVSDSRTFDIDNTAPVFVIKNPGVLKTSSASPSAYGSIFTIEGTISELHAVTSMDVTVFNGENQIVSHENYDGEELDSFREENIEISGGTSVIIAQSGSSSDTRYSQIYGESEGTQQFTCSIKLSDDAKRYVTPPEGSDSRTAEEISSDERGNSTCSLYLYDDVYDSLLSQKNASSIKLTAGDLKNVINGTLKNTSALEILRAAEKNTQSAAEEADKRLYFSLNPNANPTYQVNGFEFKFGSSANQQASAGNAVSVTVSQGLDQTQIDLDGNEKSGATVKVWMKEFDTVPESEEALKSEIVEKLAAKVKALEDEDASFTEYSKASEENPATDIAEGWKLIYDYGQHNSGEASVSTRTFSVTLPEASIVLEKFYFLAVTGRDIDNVEFAQNTVFGFEGNEAGVPPTLTIEPLYWEGATGENRTANLLPSSDFTFKGTATLKSGSLYTALLNATITVTDQDTNTKVASVSAEIKRPGLDKGWENTDAFACDGEGNWFLNLSKLPDYGEIAAPKEKSYLYTLELYGKASSGHYNTVSQNLQVDTKVPVVEISSITPVLDEYDGKTGPFVNGTITVKGAVEESNLEKVEMQVYVDDELKGEPIDLRKSYSITVPIDTTGLPDGKLDIRLFATDKVGNRGEFFSQTSGYSGLSVNQESDRPVISLSNASKIYEFQDENKELNIGTEKGNLFGTISNNKITAAISDDDSIVTVKVTLFDKDGKELSGDKVSSTYKKNPYEIPVNKSTYTLSYVLPPEEGVYKIRIDALDYLESEANSKEKGIGTTGEFFIAVSAGAPAINIDYVNTYQTERPVFSGTVSSKEASVSAQFTSATIGTTAANNDELKKLSENLAVTVDTENSLTWKCALKESTPPLKLENGKYGLVFTAYNRYGESNSVKTEFTVDNQAPDLKLTEYNSKESPDDTGYTGSIDFYLNPANIKTLKGTCGDDVSGIDSVYFKLRDYAESEIPSTEKGWLPATLTKDGSITKWTVSLTDLGLAEDERCTVHIKATDKAGNASADCDVIKLIVDSTAPTTTLSGTEIFDADGNPATELTDGGTYFAKQVFSISGTITEKNSASIKINGSEDGITRTENPWTFTPENFNEGSAVYKITLADEAENQSEYAVTVTYDITAPTLALTSPLAESNILTTNLTLAGSVSDTGSGVKQLNYRIEPISGTGTTLEASRTVSLSGRWSIDDLNLTAEGKYKVTLTATDVLGNTSAESTVEFYHDKTAPELTASVSDTAKFKYTNPTDGKTYRVYGSNSFNIEATATDGVSGISSVTANSTSTLVKGEDGIWRGTVIANPEENGNAKITVVAADKFGNPATVTIDDLFIDTKAPEFSGTIDYPQNPTKETFTLSGTVTDNLGAGNIESVIVKDSVDSSKTYNATLATEDSAIRWTLTLTPDADAKGENQTKDGIHTYTVTASDKLGNKSSVNCIVTTDTTAPYWYTGNEKDKLPYISTKASDQKITISDSNGTTADYSLYNSSSLMIAAKAKDATTTEIKLLYSVNGSEWTETDNGSIEIETGITEGINQVKIKARDEASNENSEITVSFFADRTAPKAPELKSVDGNSNSDLIENLKKQSSDKLVNGTQDVTFTVEVEDDISGGPDTVSGIHSVQLTKIGTTILNPPIEGIPAEENLYEITLPKEKFATGSVTVTVKDKAGNSTDLGLFNLRLDNTNPSITLNAPGDSDTSTAERDVNKTISLSGSASDNQGLDTSSLKLEYSTDNANWTELSSSNAGETFAVTLIDSVISVKNLDTTKFSDKSTLYIRATISDEAKNSAQSNLLELYINQDTDRPAVKISNLVKSNGTFLLKYGTDAQISGTITDDDATETAIIEKLVISDKPYTGTEEVTNRATFTKNSGDFTFTPADKTDGEKTLYFYIKDNNGNEFYTTAATSAENPKLYLKGEKLDDSYAAQKLTYKSDSNSPTVTEMKGELYKDNSGTVTVPDYSFSDANSTLSTSFVAGGSERRYAKFRFEAQDSSGIEGMTFELFDEKNNSVLKLKTSGTIAAEDFTTSGTLTVSATDSTVSVWTTEIIDLENLTTSQYMAKVTPYDNAGLSGNGNVYFNVDNSAPTIRIQTPAAGTEVTGVISITGTANDSGSAGTQNLQWLIPTQSELTAANAMTEAEKLEYLKGLAWNGGEDSLAAGTTVTSWKFDFDGKNDSATSDPENFIFRGGNPVLDVYDSSNFASEITDGVYTLPILFMATDSIGNYSIYESYTLRHNPDGDKPKLDFLYPTVSDYASGEKYAVLGGTIRATGSAVIPSGTTTVNSVYYQIADENGKFTDTDKNTAQTTYGYTVLSAYDVAKTVLGTDYTQRSVSEDVLKKLGFATQEEMDAWWGIKANGTAAWNILLNEKGELNPKDELQSETQNNENPTTNITVRVCGVNAEGKFGAWTSGDNIIAIHIDNTAPVISSAVKQYANPITSNPAAEPAATASQIYKTDMFLKGDWYLTATLLDETGVKSYSVNKGNSLLNKGTGYFVQESVTESGKNGVRLYIPIDKSSDSVSYTIEANDAEHTATQTFSFKLDNTAPTLDSLTGNGSDLISGKTVEDSNYVYTIGGKSDDTGSGVERVLFYFMRKAEITQTTIGNQVILDPMITTGTQDSKVPLSSLTPLEISQGGEKFTLYAKKQEGSSTTDTFTLTSEDSHIRTGGLIYIDGLYRKITKIEGKDVTFEPALSETKGSIEAYFPIAQVIDNSATEKVKSSSSNSFEFESGDDGDGMPETFSKTGTTWTWDASIHSTNMPDGPATLVILAFDEAGNVNGKSFNLMIANNAPRLAKVWLGTDLNNDNKFTDDSTIKEIVEYNILGAEGNEQKEYTLDFTAKLKDGTTPKFPAGTFKIKKDLAVIPEFTGGNGSIGMIPNTSATDTTKTTGTVKGASASDVTGTGTEKTLTDITDGSFTSQKLTASAKANSIYAFVMKKNELGADGTDKGISFTFWDETEETVQGTDSQYSVLYVKNFTVAQTDRTRPNAVIDTFKWHSLTDNSIYGSETAESFTDLKGHIELEDDWKKASGYNAEATNGQFDGDPKVSGKITIRGSAYDDTNLTALYAAIDGFTFANSTASTGLTKTTVTTTEKGTPKTRTMVQLATYADGSWTPTSGGMDEYGWNFTVTDGGIDQTGHRVIWQLDWDTSKISGIVGADKTIAIAAQDYTGNYSWQTASIQPEDETAHNNPEYRVDVVPYVTEIKNSMLTKKHKSKGSVYGQSSTGGYSVNATETVTIEGFNIGDTKTISMSKISTGNYDYTVSGIKALNNYNNNAAHGEAPETSLVNFYNKRPNNENNNILTDDIKFYVWETKYGAQSNNGRLSEPVMKIDPKTLQIKFAFRNSADSFSMGGSSDSSTDHSYQVWQGNYAAFRNIAFAIDTNGVTHGIAAGIDTNPQTNSLAAGKLSYFSSKWGTSGSGSEGNYGGTNAIRFDSIGVSSNYKDYVKGVAVSGTIIDEYRYESPVLATTVYNNVTNIYAAYYDSLQGQIRFRYGTLPSSKTNFGQFVDNKTRTNADPGKVPFDAHPDNYSLIAGNDAVDYTTKQTGYKAGSAVAIDAIAGATDVVIAVFTDGQNLYYTYKINPATDYDLGEGGKYGSTSNGTSFTNSGYWSEPKTIFTGGGKYCSIKADALGGIHIAAFDDKVNQDLKYAYLEHYWSNYSEDTDSVIVDGYGITGTHVNIDVQLEIVGSGYKAVPYISYYNDSTCLTKLAYLLPQKDGESITMNYRLSGVDDYDRYTGNWEVIIIPTENEIQQDNTSIGLWKQISTGNIGKVYPSDDADIKAQAGKTTTPTAKTGECYGNGTINPVIAYGITDGAQGKIEIAQLK